MASGISRLVGGWCVALAAIFCAVVVRAQGIKDPNVAGVFYPADSTQLSREVEECLSRAKKSQVPGHVFALICPHAGYEYSGDIAAAGYALIKNKPYKTVVVIGPSHYYGFKGISVYPEGVFRTPLGDVQVDARFSGELLNQDHSVVFDPSAFQKEHSIEVQLPFLQKTLSDFKIVPVVMGQCDFATCKRFAQLLAHAADHRDDVLIVASTDMYHGYDYREAELIDALTIAYLKRMDAQGLFEGVQNGTMQMCGGYPVVSTILAALELGHRSLMLLDYTNSAEVTGKKIKGVWTVGYSCSAIDSPDSGDTTDHSKGDTMMLDKEQRKKLLKIARGSIETYLENGKKLQVAEDDTILNGKMGAFVTLREGGALRGCIGNLVGEKPLYLTVRDMAVEAATGDPRFAPVEAGELKDISIEISVLSPLKLVASSEDIVLGRDGVLVRKGIAGGVFLPQVAEETGWSKEEFLSNLCAHKAGLPADAWKDTSTQLYTFTAEVFSEDHY